MSVGGEVSTGSVEVGFTGNCGSDIISDPPEGWDDSPASASINCINDQEIEIIITNAYPGLEAQLWYEINNTGTMPVRFTDYDFSSYGDLIVTNSILPEVLHIGNTATGNINIIVKDDATPGSKFVLSVGINYEPYY